MQTTKFLPSLVWSHSGAERTSIGALLFADPETEEIRSLIKGHERRLTIFLDHSSRIVFLRGRHKDGDWYVQWGERSLSTSGGFLE